LKLNLQILVDLLVPTYLAVTVGTLSHL
jgi:hypothetical protein